MPTAYGMVAGRDHRAPQPEPDEGGGRLVRCVGCGRLVPISKFAVYKNGIRSRKCDACRKRSKTRG